MALIVTGCGGETPRTTPEPSSDPAASPDVVFGRAPAAVDGLPSVVILHDRPNADVSTPSDTAVLDQDGLEFVPSLLLVRAGQPVRFTNSEPVDHNVRLVDTATDATALDVATPVGVGIDHVFTEDAHYAVFCDTHPWMTAQILVVSSPFAVIADEDGAFSIEGVPPGRYDVTVWSADPAVRFQGEVTVEGPSTELVLVGS